LRQGMSIVGERFGSKEYFLPDLIISSEIFKQAIAIIEPHFGDEEAESKGTVVIGTVQGDIHDIGKNLVATMLSCSGYEVHDLGVDVQSQAFVDRAKETGAALVAMSGLLTTSFDPMKNTVDALIEAGMRDKIKVIIGGGPINETVVDYTGADAFGLNPAEAVSLAERFIVPSAG
jgi:methanogenic corrinoid protein MtbC1